MKSRFRFERVAQYLSCTSTSFTDTLSINLVSGVLLDRRLHRLPLVWLHVFGRECLTHELQPFVDFAVVGGGAVFTEKELDHEGRHAEGRAHAPEQVFADDHAGESLVGEEVEGVEFDGSVGHGAGVLKLEIAGDVESYALGTGELLAGVGVADFQAECIALLEGEFGIEEQGEWNFHPCLHLSLFRFTLR
jgi:hypothetical protein